jgi:hypothetical protein
MGTIQDGATGNNSAQVFFAQSPPVLRLSHWIRCSIGYEMVIQLINRWKLHQRYDKIQFRICINMHV